MKNIVNNIFFSEVLKEKLLKSIPESVMNFWDVKLKSTGLVRYDKNTLHSLYIDISCKFNDDSVIKFVAGDSFTFDSVYSKNDAITGERIYPHEHRYDINLNILAKYVFATPPPDDTPFDVICIQYKNGEKVKEYIYSHCEFSDELLNTLSEFIDIKTEEKLSDINCFSISNSDAVYYLIR
jgi:hypothetical protein